MYRFLFLVLLVFCCACDNNNQKPVPYKERVLKYLPKDSKQVKELGNGWVSFELTVEGKTRKFMAHPTATNSSGWIVTPITELSP